jgi:hypothetical protein
VGRLRGREVADWSRTAVELAASNDPLRVEAQALLGLGLAWQGMTPAPHRPDAADDLLIARAGRSFVLDVDDGPTVPAVLPGSTHDGLRSGSVWFAVWWAASNFPDSCYRS